MCRSPFKVLAIATLGFSTLIATGCASTETAESPSTGNARVAELGQRIRMAVENGDMTAEQGRERMADARKRMAAAQQSGQDAPRRTISRADYAAAAEKMKAMVASGEITEEDMNTRLGEMRRMISRDRVTPAEGSNRQVTTAAINDTCPVSGKPVGDDAPTVDLRGRKIAFCCNRCVAKFNESPREFLGALRKARKANP